MRTVPDPKIRSFFASPLGFGYDFWGVASGCWDCEDTNPPEKRSNKGFGQVIPELFYRQSG